MTNYLKVLHNTGVLLMDRTFAKKASFVGSREYNMLQEARKAYPEYEVRTKKIKRNSGKKSYKGLNYEYMEDYIQTHEPAATVEAVLDEFEEMKLISSCHSRAFKYPVIKKWFLNKYPEVKLHGVNRPSLEAIEKEAESSAA